MPDAAHADISGFIDAGLNREHARKIDFVYFLVAACDLTADLQLLSVEHFNAGNERSKRIIEQRGQHSPNLSATVLGLNTGQNKVVMSLLDEGSQDGGDAAAVRSAESFV